MIKVQIPSLMFGRTVWTAGRRILQLSPLQLHTFQVPRLGAVVHDKMKGVYPVRNGKVIEGCDAFTL
jgi:hypothetical protein